MNSKRKFDDLLSGEDEEDDNGINSILRLLKQQIDSRDKKLKSECQTLKKRNEDLLKELTIECESLKKRCEESDKAAIAVKHESEQLRRELSQMKDVIAVKDSEIIQLKNEVELTRKLYIDNKVANVRLSKQLLITPADTSIDADLNEDIDSDSDNSLDSVFTENGAGSDADTNLDSLLANCSDDTVVVDPSSAAKKVRNKKKSSSISTSLLQLGKEIVACKIPETTSLVVSPNTEEMKLETIVADAEICVNSQHSFETKDDDNDSDLEIIFETTIRTAVRQATVAETVIEDVCGVANVANVAINQSTSEAVAPQPATNEKSVTEASSITKDISQVIDKAIESTGANQTKQVENAVVVIVKNPVVAEKAVKPKKRSMDLSKVADNVLLKVCSFLKHKDLLSLRRTSKVLKTMADIALQHRKKVLTITNQHDIERIKFMINFYSSVAQLAITSLAIPFYTLMKMCETKFEHLQSLHIWLPRHPIDIKPIGVNFKNLKSLCVNCDKVDDKQMVTVFRELIKLETIEIFNTEVNGECFAALPRHVSTILWKVSDDVTISEKLSFSRSRLTSFTFKSTSNRVSYRRNMTKVVVEQMPQLKFLGLYYGNGAVDDLSNLHQVLLKDIRLKASFLPEAHMFKQRMPSVHTFHVDIYRISVNNMKRVLSTFVNLKHLVFTIRQSHHLTSTVIDTIVGLHSLESIVIEARSMTEVMATQDDQNLLISAVARLSSVNQIHLKFETSCFKSLVNYDQLDQFFKLLTSVAIKQKNQRFRVILPFTRSQSAINPDVHNFVINHM